MPLSPLGAWLKTEKAEPDRVNTAFKHCVFSYCRNGVGYPQLTDSDTAEKVLTTILRQLNFRCGYSLTCFCQRMSLGDEDH